MALIWLSTPHLRPDYRGPVSRPYHPLPAPAHAAPFVQALCDVAQRWPDRIAISDVAGPMCYRELWEAVKQLAAVIHYDHRDRGPIGILLPASALYVAAVFACLAAGRMSVLLDEGYPARRNADIAAATRLTLLLVGEKPDAALFGPDVAILPVEDALATRQSAALAGELGLGFDDPAFILCTSGSAGRPKAIVHSQATMAHWARTTHNALHVGPDDRALSLSSLSSLGGFTSVLSYPLAGACQEICDIKTQGIAGLCDILMTRPVTILRSSPAMLRTLCALPQIAATLAGLRVVQSYGEPLTLADADLIRRTVAPDCVIRTTYGSTECSGFSWFALAADAYHPVYAPAGILMPDTEAAITDSDGQPCAPGEPGELLIRSRYNALGEWVDGRLVAGRLRPDPDDPQARIYHTGDIARVNAEGVFVVLGRKDRMLKINGQRLEPAEIEAILRAHGEVARAEVLTDGAASPARLFAFVVPTAAAEPDLARRLTNALRARLPAYMVPSRIILLSEIPLLPGGKVDGCAMLGSIHTQPMRVDRAS